jgi:hypothetical protein
MKTPLCIVFLVALALYSCKDNTYSKKSKQKVRLDITKTAHDTPARIQEPLDDTVNIPSSIKSFDVDFFPVTNEMFKKYATKIKDGYQFTDEYVWFSNKATNQTLVFELYTDFHRLWAYNFLNDKVSTLLLTRMEVITPEKQSPKYISDLISSANEIDLRYFTTDKGFRLGDNMEKAIQQYGEPDKRYKKGLFYIYEWDFIGDIDYESRTFHKEKINLKDKPLARDSFGHEIIMVFQNNQLVGMAFNNFIP